MSLVLASVSGLTISLLVLVTAVCTAFWIAPSINGDITLLIRGVTPSWKDLSLNVDSNVSVNDEDFGFIFYLGVAESAVTAGIFVHLEMIDCCDWSWEWDWWMSGNELWRFIGVSCVRKTSMLPCLRLRTTNYFSRGRLLLRLAHITKLFIGWNWLMGHTGLYLFTV